MMRTLLYSIIALILVAFVYWFFSENEEITFDEKTIAEGKALFTRNCMSCHGLQDDGFGPPLGGVTRLLSKEKLVNFINDPAKVLESGDERTAALHKRYKQIMPAFEWMKESEINSIIAYIQHETERHSIQPLSLESTDEVAGLTGRLVAPVNSSDLSISVKKVVQLPRIGDSSDLGVVTLRAHPSGDGTLLASDQHGVIYRIKDGKYDIFLDIHDYVEDFQSGPGIATGLGSFDFHPDFLNNGLLYISHAETYKGQQADYTATTDSLKSVVQWIVGEWKMDDPKSTVFEGTRREMLRLHAPNFAHGCQELAFVPDLDKNDPDYGLLYFGYGDGGSNNIKRPELGHHLKSFLGSIMRIDPAGNNSNNGKYGIPNSNPFSNESDPEIVKEIYAYGFRNPHRMTWDKANGNRMLATDIGEANIEELNVIENGGDYGWPNREGDYGIATLKDVKTVFKLQPSDLELYNRPLLQYDHEEGNAISGGHIYDGDIELLRNKYIFGDIVRGKLYFANMDAQLSDSTIYELPIRYEDKSTNFKELCTTNRLHLRVVYDQIQKQLYIITKVDGKIWRVVDANRS